MMPFNANFERHVEKYGLHFIAKIFRELDPIVALVRREIRRIDIIHWTSRNQARFEHGAQIRKHQILKTLLLRIIKKHCAQDVA